MARPNRTVQVNVAFFDYLQNRLNEVMHLITKKQSLNAEDIQALRILCDVYTDTLNLQYSMEARNENKALPNRTQTR